MANITFGGLWTMADCKNGRILLVNTRVAPTTDDVKKNAIDMCYERRYAGMSGRTTRDVALGRTVPWPCVEATWEYLKGPIVERPVSTYAGIFPFATVDLVYRLAHVLHVLEPGWEQPDWPQHGELWLRWGIDGVPRWRTHYVTLTMALTGKHHDFKLHAVERYAHCAVLHRPVSRSHSLFLKNGKVQVCSCSAAKVSILCALFCKAHVLAKQ